ncbi:hypothetical protein DER44DRAFT_84733 [Fusarium oxysporum]|nr:hypothetical protein DER44DRAFT_84733 [Fusarium oxysporum]
MYVLDPSPLALPDHKLLSRNLNFVCRAWVLFFLFIQFGTNHNGLQSLVDGSVERLRPDNLLTLSAHNEGKPRFFPTQAQHRHQGQVSSHHSRQQVLTCSYVLYLLQILALLLLNFGFSFYHSQRPIPVFINRAGFDLRFGLGKELPPRRKVVWIWICCQCGHGGMKVNIDPCPYCSTPRCPNCETQRLQGRP